MKCILLFASLAACAAGPSYVKPDLPHRVDWEASAQGTTKGPADESGLAQWWSTFGDTELTSLVERASSESLDLLQAKARLREARARRGSSAADLYPTVSGSASATRTTPTGSDQFQAGIDASWEIDLFGGTRRAIESATATEQAALEDLNDARVSLAAEVGLTYLDLRTMERRLQLAQRSLQALQESADLTKWRAEVGLTTGLDAEQARANLEQERAAIPALERDVQKDRNALAVLLGVQPGTLDEELAAPRRTASVERAVGVGVPAEALRRRPDVRRAERKLAAQTAQVGVAEAARFPTLTLSGSIGLDSLSSGGGFTSSLSASLLAPIFNAGKLKRNVEVQEAILDQSLLTYRAAVLGALKDVENALVAFDREQARRTSLRAAVDAAQNAATLARDQYESGLVSFTSVLDAQRTLLGLQDSLAGSEGDASGDVIRLYKALGGGWSSAQKESL